MYELYIDSKIVATPPDAGSASVACLRTCLSTRVLSIPVGAGDFSLFALIQQFCLLNSNPGLKHFPIKPKLEDHPVEREARSTGSPQDICTEALPATERQIPSVWKTCWSWQDGPEMSVS